MLRISCVVFIDVNSKPASPICLHVLKSHRMFELILPSYDAVALDVNRAAYKAMIWMKAANADFRARGSNKYRLLGYRIGCTETSLDE